MTTTIWIIIAVLSLLLGYFLIQLTRDIIWNRKLNAFQEEAGVKIKKERTFFWLKRSYGALVSGVFLLATIFSLSLIDNEPNVINEKIILNAKSVHNEETLLRLTKDYKEGIGDRPWFDYGVKEDAQPESSLPPSSSARNDRDYIGTTTQVEGVDEGDVLKTDGYNIFYAPRYQNQIKVLSILDDGSAELTSEIDLKDTYVDALYLTDDYLVVIGYYYNYYPYYSEFAIDYNKPALSYGFRVVSYTGVISVYNKTTLELEYSLTTDTNFYEHRLIDNTLFLVSRKNTYDEEVRPLFITNIGATEEEKTYLNYKDIYHFDERRSYSMTVLTGLNLKDFTRNSQAFLGDVNLIYANDKHLYTTSTYDTFSIFSSKTKTRIVKYELNASEAKIKYLAVGSVDGYIQDSYWMDEYDNNLRVVTSSWSPVKNRLFVLKEDDTYDKLEIIGSITENLGEPGETIRSVTYHEDVAYVVTFLQIDPRYMIDLSNPKKPLILNAEKITGYSTYLHVWNKDEGSTEVVGFGYETNEFGMTIGYKLTAANDSKGISADYILLFNDKNSSWIHTSAVFDPKAIMVSPEYNIFAFPISVYSQGIYTNKYLVFTIDFNKENPDDIISEPLIIEQNPSTYYFPLERGTFIEQTGNDPFKFIYVFSNQGLIGYDLIKNEIGQILDFNN